MKIFLFTLDLGDKTIGLATITSCEVFFLQEFIK